MEYINIHGNKFKVINQISTKTDGKNITEVFLTKKDNDFYLVKQTINYKNINKPTLYDWKIIDDETAKKFLI